MAIAGDGLVSDAMSGHVAGIGNLVFSLGADAPVGPGAGRVTVRPGSVAEAAFTETVVVQISGGALTIDGSGLAGRGFVGGALGDVFWFGAEGRVLRRRPQ